MIILEGKEMVQLILVVTYSSISYKYNNSFYGFDRSRFSDKPYIKYKAGPAHCVRCTLTHKN